MEDVEIFLNMENGALKVDLEMDLFLFLDEDKIDEIENYEDISSQYNVGVFQIEKDSIEFIPARYICIDGMPSKNDIKFAVGEVLKRVVAIPEDEDEEQIRDHILLQQALKKEVLTTSELAELKGVDVSTGRRWIDKQLIPAKKVGRNWVVSSKDAIDFNPPESGRPICEIDFDAILEKAKNLGIISVGHFKEGRYGGGLAFWNEWISTNGVPESQMEEYISVKCNIHKNVCKYTHVNNMKATKIEAETHWIDEFRDPTGFFLDFLDNLKVEGSVSSAVSLTLGLGPEY